jgi:hypothetical protein
VAAAGEMAGGGQTTQSGSDDDDAHGPMLALLGGRWAGTLAP